MGKRDDWNLRNRNAHHHRFAHFVRGKTQNFARHIRAAVLESEFRLPKYKAYLLFPDGYPVAKIALTNDHIIARGNANQPSYIEGEVAVTLWKRTLEAGGVPQPLPDGMI